MDNDIESRCAGWWRRRFRLRFADCLRVSLAAMVLIPLWCFTPPAEPAFRLCGFHWLTGRPCPLCGLTRALFALAKGHFSQAIGCNALSPLALLMLGALWWDSPWRGRLWSGGMVAFALYGIGRIFVPFL